MPQKIINRKGYSIKNEANNERVYNLYIYEEIDAWWGVNKIQILQDLKAIKPTEINMYISSLGGDVDQAIAIRNLIKAQGVPVTAYLTSFVASSATICMTAADKILATFDTLILAHEAMTGGGNKSQQQKNIETLEKVDDIIATYYADKAASNGKEKFDKAYFLDLMKEDAWKTADYWKSLGVVDEIVEKLEIAASATEPDFTKEYFNKFNLKNPIMPKNKGKKGKKYLNQFKTAVKNYGAANNLDNEKVVNELAVEAELETTEVQAYLDGTQETIDNDALEVFAAHLGVDNFDEAPAGDGDDNDGDDGDGDGNDGDGNDGDGDGNDDQAQAIQDAVTKALAPVLNILNGSKDGKAPKKPATNNAANAALIEAVGTGISNAFGGIIATKDGELKNLKGTVKDLTKQVKDLAGAGSGGNNNGSSLDDDNDDWADGNDAALKNASKKHFKG